MNRAKDNAPGLAGGGGVEGVGNEGRGDSAQPAHSRQALRIIEGEQKARAYLARLCQQQAAPDDLALIVAMLCGDSLRGFCRVIEKALGVRHG